MLHTMHDSELIKTLHIRSRRDHVSDPDMRTANFEFSCDVYREGVY